jgi:hypothetical protein
LKSQEAHPVTVSYPASISGAHREMIQEGARLLHRSVS